MAEKDDWLGELRWMGYPKLQPVADMTAKADALQDNPPPPRRTLDNKRVESLARENEALRAKLDAAGRLVSEFEKRLSSAGESYEGALLEADSARRQAELERENLLGSFNSAKAELDRLLARDKTREAELEVERGRNQAAEKARAEAARRMEEAEARLADEKARAAKLEGQLAELRRQADGAQEALLRATAHTDGDVRLLRQEMREFLIKVKRLKDLEDEP